jgi:microsomal dipeptidase-like Zn-dependent dipeptidase
MKHLIVLVVALLAIALAILQWVVPPLLEGSTNLVGEHRTWEIRPEVRKLHDRLFVADLHTDSLLWKRDLLRRSDVGHVDLPRLDEGNVALQVFSATTKSPSGQNYDENTADSDDITLLTLAQLWPVRTWGSIFERARYQLAKLRQFERDSNGGLLVVESAADLREVVRRRLQGERVVGAIYLIEGAHPLEGDLDKLDILFDEGLRIAGLTHFFDNELGGSLHGVSGEGLTPFGREVIERANELGMIIDVAHASPRMVSDVLDLSDAPVVLSHGGIKSACDVGRNLDDDLMQRIAERGGIAGIGFWDGAVCDFTPAGVARSIRKAVAVMGIDHVALGSDYDGATEVMFDASELAILTQALLDAGLSDTEVAKVMGENALRFFLDNLPDA